MKIVESKLKELIENCTIDIAYEYGEPSYSLEDEKKAILLADWNKFEDSFIQELEKSYAIEWFDEWITDYGSGKIYRTVGDSYSWEQSFRITEGGELITPDSDIEEWINNCEHTYDYGIETPRILPSFIKCEDLKGEGYTNIEDEKEIGLHPHMNDDPTKILQDLLPLYSSLLFQLSYSSQFSSGFIIWVK